MKKSKSILFFLMLFILSCSEDKYSPEMFMPEAHGEPGKVLVVLEKEFWDSELEKLVINKLQQPILTLPQPEELFTLQIAPRSSFNQGLKTNHTIIIFEIENNANNKNARLEEPKIDLWAKGQVVYKFRASNQNDAIKLFNQNVELLISLINNSNREKLIKLNEANKNKGIASSLKSIQKMELTVPNSMKLEENQEGFAWLKQYKTKWDEGAEHEIQQGILIYSYPYTDTNTFTYNYQISKRDSVLKYSVPGPSESSFMATERTKGVEPMFYERNFNNTYVFELRGLWKVEGDLMGGPFISISSYDEANRRVVTIEGYVYAPHFDKRELVRELEAMIYTYKFY